jgi:uncharacterized protein YjbJ (UPF0337 family)
LRQCNPNRVGTRAEGSLLVLHMEGGVHHGLEPCGRKLEAGKGKDQRKWGRLTDDDLDVINGRRDQLEGKIQDRYGLAKDQVQKDVDDWYTAQRW